MHTEPNSEDGVMTDNLYMTEEIKVCPECGERVRETYRAERLDRINPPIEKV
jgi:uncharacterized protein with PIN domain